MMSVFLAFSCLRHGRFKNRFSDSEALTGVAVKGQLWSQLAKWCTGRRVHFTAGSEMVSSAGESVRSALGCRAQGDRILLEARMPPSRHSVLAVLGLRLCDVTAASLLLWSSSSDITTKPWQADCLGSCLKVREEDGPGEEMVWPSRTFLSNQDVLPLYFHNFLSSKYYLKISICLNTAVFNIVGRAGEL